MDLSDASALGEKGDVLAVFKKHRFHRENDKFKYPNHHPSTLNPQLRSPVFVNVIVIVAAVRMLRCTLPGQK